MTKRNEIAAQLHEHLCTHNWHGYTQGSGRNGDGEGVCSLNIGGEIYSVEQGDRDCSSSVIECWQVALQGTPYEGRLDGATYTGNMRQVFTASGLFEWKPMSFIADRGDVYLAHRADVAHTAMCQTPSPDMLSEFCINEKGGIVGGAVGDQTGHESHVRGYYDLPWDGILHYNGKADPVKAAAKSIDQLAQEVLDGKHGNGEARRKALGAQYDAVQARVNEMLKGGGKSLDSVARDVIDGKYGNGADRVKRLAAAGYDYAEVQARVNELLK